MDPDLGWHIRLGQYILTNGFPTSDPFSYTMPTFPFLDHEWFSDIIIYKLYLLGGITPLAILYSLIPVISLLIMIPRRFFINAAIPLLLITPLLLEFAGIRTQLESWLGVAIMIKLSLDRDLWLKHRYFIPALFLIWANLHGGYLIGWAILFLGIIITSFERRKVDFKDIIVFAASISVTIINPYTYHLWQRTLEESITAMTNSYIKEGIDEWSPLYSRFSFLLVIFFLSSLFLVIRYRSKLSLLQISFYFVFLGAACISRRHAPFWFLLSIPLFSQTLSYFFVDLSRIKQIKKIHIQPYQFFIGFFLFIIIIAGFQDRNVEMSSLSWTEVYRYPAGAATFLTLHPPKGHILSPYTWAGYLLWKDPSQKDYVDGRMPGWIMSASSTESSWAYHDFNDLVSGKINILTQIDKYHITNIVWSQNDYKQIPLINTLMTKYGWKKTYNDPVSVIISAPVSK